MSITIRSKILIAVGTLIYGEPKGTGTNCTAAEFYCLTADRTSANPKKFHPLMASKWTTMRTNKMIDDARRRAFKHVCLCSFVLSLGIYTTGSLLTAGIVKTKSVAGSITEKYSENEATKQSIQDRLKQIEADASALTVGAANGTVSEEQYKTKSQALQKEYTQLKEQL